jgi:hypothetical protein
MLTKVDVYVVAIVMLMSIAGAITVIVKIRPSVQALVEIAALFNSKGGLIMLMSSLWVFTLLITIAFAVWIIAKGVDPSHAVVVALLAMLTGNAFGNVNGALLKTMTGEDPKPPIQTESSTNTTTRTVAPVVTNEHTEAGK